MLIQPVMAGYCTSETGRRPIGGGRNRAFAGPLSPCRFKPVTVTAIIRANTQTREPWMNIDNRQKSKNFRALRGIVSYLRPYVWYVAGALLALVFTAAITLSIGQGLKLLIDEGFGAGAGSGLDRAVLFFLFLVVLMAIGTYARFYLVSWIGERVSADLRRAVFNHVIDLHPGYFETNLSGEIQSRITTDTTLLQTVIGSSLSMALRNVLIFIGGVAWLFVTNPKLTLVVLISVPLVVMPIMVFGRKVRRLSRASQDRVADVGGFVGEAIKNIKVLQAFNHQQRDIEAFSSQVEAAFDVGLQRIRQRALLTSVVIALVLGAVAAMLWVGGHDVIAGRITGGELAAFVFYAVMVATAVGAISEVYGELQRAAGATERLLELLHAESLLAGAGRASVADGTRAWRIDYRPDQLRLSIAAGCACDRPAQPAAACFRQPGPGGQFRCREIHPGRLDSAFLRCPVRCHPL